MRPIPTTGALTIEIKLQLNTAEAGVRELPIAYRKCRYPDENILKYFQVRKTFHILYYFIILPNFKTISNKFLKTCKHW